MRQQYKLIAREEIINKSISLEKNNVIKFKVNREIIPICLIKKKSGGYEKIHPNHIENRQDVFREIDIVLQDYMDTLYFIVKTNGCKTLKDLQYTLQWGTNEDEVHNPFFVADVSHCDNYHSMLIGLLVFDEFYSVWNPSTIFKLSQTTSVNTLLDHYASFS